MFINCANVVKQISLLFIAIFFVIFVVVTTFNV